LGFDGGCGILEKYKGALQGGEASKSEAVACAGDEAVITLAGT